MALEIKSLSTGIRGSQFLTLVSHPQGANLESMSFPRAFWNVQWFLTVTYVATVTSGIYVFSVSVISFLGVGGQWKWIFPKCLIRWTVRAVRQHPVPSATDLWLLLSFVFPCASGSFCSDPRMPASQIGTYSFDTASIHLLPILVQDVQFECPILSASRSLCLQNVGCILPNSCFECLFEKDPSSLQPQIGMGVLEKSLLSIVRVAGFPTYSEALTFLFFFFVVSQALW